MKTLKNYLAESETWMHTPAEGDDFAIELADGTLVESYIMETADDCILLDATADIVAVLESWNLLSDQESEDSVILETMSYGTLGEENQDEILKRQQSGLQALQATMDFAQQHGYIIKRSPTGKTAKFVNKAIDHRVDTKISADPKTGQIYIDFWSSAYSFDTGGEDEAEGFDETFEYLYNYAMESSMGREEEDDIDEAKYHGREVPLGKPMAGDVKKSKVYVKDPSTGNIKKVNFGDPNMRIKKTSPAHRKSFRARHHCENPGSRLKARYWSCRAW